MSVKSEVRLNRSDSGDVALEAAEEIVNELATRNKFDTAIVVTKKLLEGFPFDEEGQSKNFFVAGLSCD